MFVISLPVLYGCEMSLLWEKVKVKGKVHPRTGHKGPTGE